MSGRRFIQSSGDPVATSFGSSGSFVSGDRVRAQRVDGPRREHGEALFLAHEVGLGERQARGNASHLSLGLRQVESVRTAGLEACGQDADVVLLVRELLAPKRQPLACADQREPGLRGLGDDRELRGPRAGPVRDSTRRSIAWYSFRSEPKRSISQLASKPARYVSVLMPPGASGSWVLNCAFSRPAEAVTVGNHE
jgi:hypothetical protein